MNPTLPELQRELQQLDIRRRQLKRAIKASKPKQRKVRTTEERERARLYREFLIEQCTSCWACGRTADDNPEWYHLPWVIQRAHIVNRPRVEDVRAVASLCPCCHFGGCHSFRFPKWTLPKLTVGNLIHLKAVFDVDNFCTKFLREHNGNRPLPRAEALPPEYIESQRRFGR